MRPTLAAGTLCLKRHRVLHRNKKTRFREKTEREREQDGKTDRQTNRHTGGRQRERDHDGETDRQTDI